MKYACISYLHMGDACIKLFVLQPVSVQREPITKEELAMRLECRTQIKNVCVQRQSSHSVISDNETTNNLNKVKNVWHLNKAVIDRGQPHLLLTGIFSPVFNVMNTQVPIWL